MPAPRHGRRAVREPHVASRCPRCRLTAGSDDGVAPRHDEHRPHAIPAAAATALRRRDGATPAFALQALPDALDVPLLPSGLDILPGAMDPLHQRHGSPPPPSSPTSRSMACCARATRRLAVASEHRQIRATSSSVSPSMQWRTKATRSSTGHAVEHLVHGGEQQPIERIRPGVDQGRRRPIVVADPSHRHIRRNRRRRRTMRTATVASHALVAPGSRRRPSPPAAARKTSWTTSSRSGTRGSSRNTTAAT